MDGRTTKLSGIISGICCALITHLQLEVKQLFVFPGVAVVRAVNHLGVVAAERNRISTVPVIWSQEGRTLDVTVTSHVLWHCCWWQDEGFQMQTCLRCHPCAVNPKPWEVSLVTSCCSRSLLLQPGGIAGHVLQQLKFKPRLSPNGWLLRGASCQLQMC